MKNWLFCHLKFEITQNVWKKILVDYEVCKLLGISLRNVLQPIVIFPREHIWRRNFSSSSTPKPTSEPRLKKTKNAENLGYLKR